MNAPTGDEKHTVTLLPHQAKFVETVLSPTTKRTIVLRGAVGLGKSAAMVALIGRLLRERPEARALVLCPASLSAQWVYRLRDEDVQTLQVDRYKFRELVDSTSSGEVWRRGSAVVMSDDFAKQTDIRGSLARTEWTIVIADEAHRFTGLRADLLRSLVVVAERLVLTTATPLGPEDGLPVSLGDATVVDWRVEDVVDTAGRPLVTVLPPEVDEVSFALSPSERSLSDAVHSLAQSIERSTPQTRFLAVSLLRRFHSSPAALESTLRTLRNALAHQGDISSFLQDEAENGELAAAEAVIDAIASQPAWTSVAQILDQLDTSSSDSKLTAFTELLIRLAGTNVPTTRIMVITDYLSTLYYLAAELDGRGLQYSLLHGGMTYEDRELTLARFESSGGTLIATSAVASAGIDLPLVTDLVLYDFPRSPLALVQLLGRFDRFGRTSRLVVHVLLQKDGVDATILDLLRRLREASAEKDA